MKVAANGTVYFQNSDQTLIYPLKRKGLKKLNVSLFSIIGQIKSAMVREEHVERKYHHQGFLNCPTPSVLLGTTGAKRTSCKQSLQDAGALNRW